MEINYNIDRLAQTLSILGDYSRLNIVVHLMEHEANVSEITQITHLSQPLVSHHLRLLKDARILKSQKKGKCVYYSINDEHVKQIVSSGLIHMEHGD